MSTTPEEIEKLKGKVKEAEDNLSAARDALMVAQTTDLADGFIERTYGEKGDSKSK
jgi:hypothetical protein